MIAGIPRTLTLILCVFLLVLVGAGEARAWCQLTTAPPDPEDPLACVEDGAPLAWRRGNLNYSFQMDGARTLNRSAVELTFSQAFDAWLVLDCGGAGHGFEVRRGTDVVCDTPFHANRGPNNHLIAFVDDWNARGYPRRALANTTIWFLPSTGEIVDVDMEVNEQNRDLEVCPRQGCREGFIDLPSVATHEVGHFFGLGHSDVREATMFPEADANLTGLRTLAGDDVEGFCAIYGGIGLRDSSFEPRGGFTTECAANTSGGGSGGCAVGGPLDAAPAAGLLAVGLAVIGGGWRRRGHARRRGAHTPAG
jgi:hypothetical protein